VILAIAHLNKNTILEFMLHPVPGKNKLPDAPTRRRRLGFCLSAPAFMEAEVERSFARPATIANGAGKTSTSPPRIT
jgi:hypothetical protein